MVTSRGVYPILAKVMLNASGAGPRPAAASQGACLIQHWVASVKQHRTPLFPPIHSTLFRGRRLAATVPAGLGALYKSIWMAMRRGFHTFTYLITAWRKRGSRCKKRPKIGFQNQILVQE